MITSFEENFPIIDRITGSRQTIQSDLLVYDPVRDGHTQTSMNDYMDKVEHYLNNAQKLARQLRVIIIPGVGLGSYEPNANALCLPLFPSENSGGPEVSLLSSLADYLYIIKFANEDPVHEELLLAILNKKGRGLLKLGSSDAKIKVTELIFREIMTLCGIKGYPPNPPNISSILIQQIIGSDNTMIYRELRNLSAIQKQKRYDYLREKYNCLRRGVAVEEGLIDVMLPLQKKYSRASTPKDKLSIQKVFAELQELEQFSLKEEIYDLGVLLFHYKHIDVCYHVCKMLVAIDPNFAEAYWGIGTACRSLEFTVYAQGEARLQAISNFRRFGGFKSIGPFWKKRAGDLMKKIENDL